MNACGANESSRDVHEFPLNGVRTGSSPFNVQDTKLQAFASGCTRFPSTIEQATVDSQLERSSKILARLNLEEFNANDEGSLEDWIDKMARKARQEQLCVVLFQRAWAAVSSEAIAGIISSIDPPESHERLVDVVALKLFPCSRYIIDLETEVFKGKRHTSTIAATNWLKNRIARYLRLCKRRQYEASIGPQRLPRHS